MLPVVIKGEVVGKVLIGGEGWVVAVVVYKLICKFK